MGIYTYHVELHNIKQVKGKLSKILNGQNHVCAQMPCKSSLFSPVFYNATLFSASCTHGSDARRKISGIFIEISTPEDDNFHFKVLAYVVLCQNNNSSHSALRGTANTVEVPK